MWWIAAAFAGDPGVSSDRDRDDIVRGGVGFPYGLAVAYERRLGDRFALGAEAGTLLVTAHVLAYGRLYLLDGRAAPFASVRAGASAAGLYATLWNGPTAGLDAGVQLRSAGGVVFDVKVGADAVFDPYGVDDVAPRIGGLATLVPELALSIGHAF
jgi:hypothetical protein